MALATSSDLANCMNELTGLNMDGIAPEATLRELISDFMSSRSTAGDDDDDDTDSETDESSDDEHESENDDDGRESDKDEQPVIENLSEDIVPLGRGDEDDDEEPRERPITCTCQLNNGAPCYTRFPIEELHDAQVQCVGMSREELDICILSKLSCGMHLSNMTTQTHRGEHTERKNQRTDFYFHGFRICRTVFKLMHGIGQDKLNALVTHYKVAGIEARVHKNRKRQPQNSFKFADTKAVIDFILNYAEGNAIMLPGRTPGHWKTDVRLLPTNCSKKKVYGDYCIAVDVANTRKVSLRSFRRLWQQLVPFIVTMRPATDLCWICQKGVTRLVRSVNLPDEEKSAALRDYEDHLQKATKERSHYQDICQAVKEQLPANTDLGPHPACSFDGKSHYSFDFAQQVHFPSNPLQPGPIYFKCTRKCGLFGVACEALPKQVNFLLEESTSTGKGANCVVSMLHYYLQHYGVGECHLYLHADNCAGQNKNSCMMWYLLWRVLTGQHKSITISFLLTGHTKFSCDWCFGLVKRLYRKTKVDCIDDIAQVVNDSSDHVNLSQKCGDESGNVFVPTYDWTAFLGKYFRKMDAIKKFHHFHFAEGSTSVEVKEYADSIPEVQHLLKATGRFPALLEFPPIIPTKGLDAKRQWYLYDEIRAFTAAHCQDITAPLPSVPKPGRAGVQIDSSSESDGDTAPPPPKAARKQGRRGRPSQK